MSHVDRPHLKARLALAALVLTTTACSPFAPEVPETGLRRGCVVGKLSTPGSLALKIRFDRDTTEVKASDILAARVGQRTDPDDLVEVVARRWTRPLFHPLSDTEQLRQMSQRKAEEALDQPTIILDPDTSLTVKKDGGCKR